MPLWYRYMERGLDLPAGRRWTCTKRAAALVRNILGARKGNVSPPLKGLTTDREEEATKRTRWTV